MNIGILGSGMVGKVIAAKLVERGQDVMIGTRTPEKLADWAAEHPEVKIGSLSDAAKHGEMLFNAIKGGASLEALKSAGEANLDGKTMIDISNPLDFSEGMPPSLFVVNTDSLGEQIQRAFPKAKVIKTFNTLNAYLMVDPGALANGDHTLFLSGDDATAKAEVTRLFSEWFGWRDILDIGDITTARGSEALLLLWLRLYMKFGHSKFQFKIVR